MVLALVPVEIWVEFGDVDGFDNSAKLHLNFLSIKKLCKTSEYMGGIGTSLRWYVYLSLQ